MSTTLKPGRAVNRHSDVLSVDADWKLYENVLDEYNELPSHVNFSNGVLELMVMSTEHERLKSLINRLIGIMAVERRIAISGCGSNTLKQMKQLKGLEPDECYYLANEKQMRSVKRIDLDIHPPPDLVVEVDVTHHVVDREAIYAAFGVPEMWLYKKGKLKAFALQNGQWELIDKSLSFPFLTVTDLNPFIARMSKDDSTSIVISFQEWLRKNVPA